MKLLKKIVFLLLPIPLTITAQTQADSMFAFFAKHKKTTAIYVIKNNVIAANYNGTDVMPIATMPNLLVAMEFAKQAAYKVIDTTERVNLKEIVKYYIENTKADTYEDWLTQMLVQKKVENNTVALIEIVHGMLQHNSLALSEYLMDKLGFDNIKSTLQSYNLNDHDAIMPWVGALALYQNRTNANEKKMAKAISDMNEEGYCKNAFLMHVAIKNDSMFKTKSFNKQLSDRFLLMWSDRLPQASTRTYATLLETVVKEKMLDAVYYRMLRKIIETPNQKYFARYSTNLTTTKNVLAQAQYTVDAKGNETVIVYTCTELKPMELQQIKRWHTDFENEIITTTTFANKLNVAK